MSATAWSQWKCVCTVDVRQSIVFFWLTKVIWRSESADLHKLFVHWPPLEHHCCPLTIQQTNLELHIPEIHSGSQKIQIKMQMDYTSPENINLNCCYVNGRMTDSEEKKQPLVVIDYVALLFDTKYDSYLNWLNLQCRTFLFPFCRRR